MSYKCNRCGKKASYRSALICSQCDGQSTSSQGTPGYTDSSFVSDYSSGSSSDSGYSGGGGSSSGAGSSGSYDSGSSGSSGGSD